MPITMSGLGLARLAAMEGFELTAEVAIWQNSSQRSCVGYDDENPAVKKKRM